MVEQGKQRTPATVADMVTEQQEITRHWPRLRFSAINVSESGGSQTYTAEAYLDGVVEPRISMELVAEASEWGPRTITEMPMQRSLAGSAHSYVYECTVPSRPEGHYTPRLRVRDDRMNLPLENPAVLWLK